MGSDWNQFIKRVSVNSPVQTVYECWAKQGGPTGGIKFSRYTGKGEADNYNQYSTDENCQYAVNAHHSIDCSGEAKDAGANGFKTQHLISDGPFA